jgi:aminopeptidase 2
LYPTSRLAKLGSEAGKGNASKFSLNDRMGLVQDASVVASSGYAKTSGSLTLLSQMKGEEENLGEQHSLPSRIACVQLRADV